MENEAAELLKRAIQLPPEERAALAESLFESLDTEADPDVEEAWTKEIARRVAEIESGAAKMIPWDEAREQLRARLKP
jgi:putative addiction module component (TIGR02574 family)